MEPSRQQLSLEKPGTAEDSVQASIVDIKRLVRARLYQSMAEASRTVNVCFDSNRSWMEIVELTTEVLGTDEDEAHDWLLGYMAVPSRKDPSVVKQNHRCKPILLVKSHVMYLVKEHVAAAYFTAIRVQRDTVTVVQAEELLENLAYLVSGSGFPSIVCGVEALFNLVGAGNRVQKPRNIGDGVVVNCTLGHVALVSSFIRMILEVKAGTHDPNGAVGEGVYSVWAQELPRVDSIFTFDDSTRNGWRLVDRANPLRAALPRVDEDGHGDGADEEANGDEDDDRNDQ